MFDSFSKRFLIINYTSFFDDNQHKLETLIDIDVIEYVFIDREITQFVCNMLNMKFVSLLKSKFLIEFDDRYASSIIHVIYFKLTINLHSEFIALLLIIDLNNHSIILEKWWMNKHQIILNMIYDKLIFKLKRCNHHENIFNATIKVKRFEIFESNRRWNVFNWRRDVVLSKVNDIEHIVIVKFRYIILFRLKIESFVFIVKNDSNSKHSFDSKVNNNNEKKIVESNNFAIDIIVVTKTFFFVLKIVY